MPALQNTVTRKRQCEKMHNPENRRMLPLTALIEQDGTRTLDGDVPRNLDRGQIGIVVERCDYGRAVIVRVQVGGCSTYLSLSDDPVAPTKLTPDHPLETAGAS